MARTPRNLAEYLEADKLNKQLVAVVDAEWDRFKFSRDWNVSNGERLREEDRKQIVIGMAIRMTDEEILKMVNEKRRADGCINASLENLNYYRVKYREIIDEIYVYAAKRIGEVYSLSDKIVRIARINELGELFRENVICSIKASGEIDKQTNINANTYLRIMSAMNVEMGSIPLNKFTEESRRNPLPELEEEDKNRPFGKGEVQDLMEKRLLERYKDQLPEADIQVLENIEENGRSPESTTSGTATKEEVRQTTEAQA